MLAYQSSPDRQDELVWQVANVLFARDGAVLPGRCVRCNSDDGVILKRKRLTWAPSWVFALILVNILIMLIVALCLQKKIWMTYGLCRQHRVRKRNLTIASLVVLAGSIGLFCAAGFLGNALYAVLGIVGVLACLIIAVVASRDFTLQRIDKGVATIRKISPDLLATLQQGRPVGLKV